jgi:hypothetical protein
MVPEEKKCSIKDRLKVQNLLYFSYFSNYSIDIQIGITGYKNG